ncbi:bifunctional tetrahydrofolate synthase/dihydrofolate synthase [Tolumonas auensis]|uniref:bifunctional tetrahydrofolate synthase/dihydrofolate synthase n=1 Tax=Tolumonas auensis TaxID=43948 RepID=UPI002AA6965F|nr:bifunctional tetrahydrofolate synthase/dihydrofolate synthase [Tolumonas auensis]
MTLPVMTQSQSLSDWLSYLEQIHPQQIELGLQRVKTVAERAALTQLPGIVITVGGTNGKGSTCAMLASILQAAGYTTGVYASPHLLRYNERVKINGHEVSDEDLCSAFAEIDQKRADISLTFFEFGTLAAFAVFKKYQPDVILLEVGLGGRLDATNIIDADISVITSIDLDHCDWLGNTRDAIATEKAGIYRSEKPAICGEPNPPQTLYAAVNQINAQLYTVGEQFSYQLTEDKWTFTGQHWQFTDLPVPALPLQNAATVLATLEHVPLSVSESAIRSGLENAQLAGRFQTLQNHPTVIIDVAHNPHAARYLAIQLGKQKADKIIAVVGMLKDKDIAHTLQHIVPYVSAWHLADLSGPRAASAGDLAALLPPESTFRCHGSVEDAYQAALTQANEHDLIIVFGSFFTVAGVLACTEQH